jgi:hypothetical protein
MNLLQENFRAPTAGPSADRITNDIRSALGSHFAAAGETVKNVSFLNILRRSYSTVFFFTIQTDKQNHRLVAKTTAHHPENRALTQRENQAVVEFNVLQRLHPRFQGVEGCRVCKPVFVLAAIETVVVEQVDGKLLADELGNARFLSSRTAFAELKTQFDRSGRWLRRFQDFTEPQEAGVDALDGIINRCDFRLRLIEEANDPRAPAGLRKQVLSRLQLERKRLQGERIPIAGRHGDFGPWNILSAPDCITVLDFFGYAQEPAAFDPLNMVMALDRERQCVTANARRIDALKKSFIEGYGSLTNTPAGVLRICETFHRICSVQGFLTNRGGSFHKRIERSRCIKTNLEWLASEQATASLWPK